MAVIIPVLILEVLVLAIGVIIGYRRGIGRGVIRLIYLSVLGLIAFFVGKAINTAVNDKVYALVRPNLGKDILAILEASPDLEKLVVGFVGALIFPLFFGLIFVLLQAISTTCLKKLSLLILHGVTKKKDDPSQNSRVIGAVIGSVTAILVLAVALSPLYTFVSILSDLSDETISGINALVEPDGQRNEPLSNIKDVLFEASASPLVGGVSGYAKLFSGTTTPGGASYNGIEEAGNLVSTGVEVVAALDEVSESDALGKVNAAGKAIMPMLSESAFTKELFADVAQGVGKVLKDGKPLFGLSVSGGDKIQNAMVGAFAGVLAKTTSNNVVANVETLFGSSAKPAKPDDPSKQPVEGDDPTTPAVLDSKGAIQYIAEANLSKPEELTKDSEKCQNLIDAIYVVSENEEMTEVVEAVGDMGGQMIRGMEEIEAMRNEDTVKGIQESLQSILESESEYEAPRSLQEKAQTVKDAIIEAVEKNENLEVTEQMAELGAISAVAEFLTEENIAAYTADPSSFNISFDDVAAYLGLNP